VTLGRANRQGDLLDDITRFCGETLGETSIYSFLHRERDNLFPDEFFTDLFDVRGRRSVPPSVVATVMVLQRLECLSDREAVDRFTFDTRWRYAAGVGGYDGEGQWSFVHTVLVEMRGRLRKSKRPDRVFEVTRDTAAAVGLVGRRRVLDSTPLYDAVATMDTITLIRSALRGLLAVAGELEPTLRNACTSGDDYVATAKPRIDWDDSAARDALIDSRARDAQACLAVLDNRKLGSDMARAAELLAAVVGQDLDEGADGTFRIARRVAKNRIISTVDTDARHGHKTSARGFDGYKGHISIDPDSEFITEAVVTAGNVGDADAADEVLDECLPEGDANASDPMSVYGDAAFGAGSVLARLDAAGATAMVKVQPPVNSTGLFTKDRFDIDLTGNTVRCPNNVTVAIVPLKGGGGVAAFGSSCDGCPLRAQCTASVAGRSIHVGSHESLLVAARERQRDPRWKEDYRTTRPKVERKIGHLMFRRHGGRRARVRGRLRVAQDFKWLAAARNLVRLATLAVNSQRGGWTVAAAP